MTLSFAYNTRGVITYLVRGGGGDVGGCRKKCKTGAGVCNGKS